MNLSFTTFDVMKKELVGILTLQSTLFVHIEQWGRSITFREENVSLEIEAFFSWDESARLWASKHRYGKINEKYISFL